MKEIAPGSGTTHGLRLRRGTITQFVERHHRAWHIGMSVLATIYIVVAIRNDETSGDLSSVVLLTLSALFLAEFLLRLWDAPSRWAYVRAHWLDAVSCIPLVGWLRIFRILRLLRLGFARRYLSTVEVHLRQRLESGHRQSLWFLAPCLIVLWVGSAYALWVIEHGQNKSLKTFGDALYWAFITSTTVGYGDVVPQTPAGKVIAGLLAFIGVGLIGFAAARLTAMWVRQEETDGVTAQDVQALHAEMAEIRRLLIEQAQAGHVLHTNGDTGTGVATASDDRQLVAEISVAGGDRRRDM